MIEQRHRIRRITLILYIIAAIFFFTGIFMLLHQIFSEGSPANKQDIAISMISTIFTVMGSFIGIISFIGNKQDLLIQGQDKLINGQEQLLGGQKQLSNDHVEIIKALQVLVNKLAERL